MAIAPNASLDTTSTRLRELALAALETRGVMEQWRLVLVAMFPPTAEPSTAFIATHRTATAQSVERASVLKQVLELARSAWHRIRNGAPAPLCASPAPQARVVPPALLVPRLLVCAQSVKAAGAWMLHPALALNAKTNQHGQQAPIFAKIAQLEPEANTA